MADNDRPRDDAAALRERAEEMWRKQALEQRPGVAPGGAAVSPEQTLSLIHELEVHQIELEIQNEEMRLAQDELATSQARYFDLYDLAPVGYLTLSESGRILEANLAAANLLGLTRTQLIKQPLAHFIVPDDQNDFYQYGRRLSTTLQPQVCELRMVRGGLASVGARPEPRQRRGADGWWPTLGAPPGHGQAEWR